MKSNTVRIHKLALLPYKSGAVSPLGHGLLPIGVMTAAHEMTGVLNILDNLVKEIQAYTC